MRKEDFFNAGSSEEKDTIVGRVSRITFKSDETGFAVVRLVPDDGLFDRITVVGVLPFISEGEHLRLYGQWTNDKKYGLQFRAESYETILPVTKKESRPISLREILREFVVPRPKKLWKNSGTTP